MKDTTKSKTYLIDATDQILGRIAVRIADILRGKDKPSFVPYSSDGGEKVVVINAKGIKLSGKKFEQKTYFRHSLYPGGLKKEKVEDLFKKNPEEIVRRAVYGMLPKNKLRERFIKKLKIFADDSYKGTGREGKI